MASYPDSDEYDSEELERCVQNYLDQEDEGTESESVTISTSGYDSTFGQNIQRGPDGRILPSEDDMNEVSFFEESDDEDEEESGYDNIESDRSEALEYEVGEDDDEEDLLGDIGRDSDLRFSDQEVEEDCDVYNEKIADHPTKQIRRGKSSERSIVKRTVPAVGESLEKTDSDVPPPLVHKEATPVAVTMKDRYKKFWSQFKTSSSVNDGAGEEEDATGRTQQVGHATFILPPMDKPFLEDTIDATLDVSTNTFGTNPERVAYRILDCDCSDFISMEDQYTTIRGRLETQKNFVIAEIKQHVETTGALQQELDDFEAQERARRRYEDGDHDYDLADHQNDAEADEVNLARERLEALATNVPVFQNMHVDREYVPTEHPMLREMRLIREERLLRDGCSNIARAMAKCPICLGADSTNITPDVASSKTIELYALWAEFCLMRCKEIAWVTMAKHWNECFVYPVTSRGQRSKIPEVNPSHMDIHFTECISSNIIPGLVNDLICIETAEKCALMNGVFTEERVAGKKTGNYSLSKTGHVSLMKLQSHKHGIQRKLTDYGMTAKFLSGTVVAPLPGLLCGKRRLGLKDYLSLRPKKNESQEANANRAMELLLGGSRSR